MSKKQNTILGTDPFLNYYELVEKDQAKTSWAVFALIKELPKRRANKELPSVIGQFFGPEPDGEMQMKDEYVHLRCKICGRYSDDDIYEIGFKEPITIRIKGDYCTTNDRVFAVSEKFISVLKQNRVGGFKTKKLGKSGWSALTVTERVKCDESAFQEIAPFCKGCKRPDRVPGSIVRMRELSLPANENTLFTTKKGWPQFGSDRYIFLTQKVADALKQGGIRGGWCKRLWTDEEGQTYDENAKRGNHRWHPKSTLITL